MEDIHSFLQISYHDQSWGFNPDWVRGTNSHLIDLINQITKIDPITNTTLITSKSDRDNELVNELNNTPQDLKIIRQSTNTYNNDGLKEVIEESNATWVFMISAYTAFLDTPLLNNIIDFLNSNSYSGVRIRKSENYPVLLKRKRFLDTLKQLQQIYRPEDNVGTNLFRNNFIQDVPIQFIPGNLSEYTLYVPTDGDAEVYKYTPAKDGKDFNKADNTEQRSEPLEKEFRPIISSEKESEFWTKQKRRHPEYSYNDHLENFISSFYQGEGIPRSVQVDLPSDLSLLPNQQLPKEYSLSDFPLEKLIQRLTEMNDSSLYETLVQIGTYHDPLVYEKIEQFLEAFSDSDLQLLLQTRLLNKKIYDLILDTVDELFIYLGSIKSDIYQQLFNHGDVKSVLSNLDNLRKKQRTRAQNQFSRGDYRLTPPLVVGAFFVTNQVIEENLIDDVSNKWTSYADFLNEKDLDPYTQGDQLIPEFYHQENTLDFINWMEIPEFPHHDNPSPSAPDYTPLNRKSCRRLRQTLTIQSNGKITMCDRDIEQKLLVGDIRNSTIKSAWKNKSRLETLQKHQQEDWASVKPCDQCSDWYQPVI